MTAKVYDRLNRDANGLINSLDHELDPLSYTCDFFEGVACTPEGEKWKAMNLRYDLIVGPRIELARCRQRFSQIASNLQKVGEELHEAEHAAGCSESVEVLSQREALLTHLSLFLR